MASRRWTRRRASETRGAAAALAAALLAAASGCSRSASATGAPDAVAVWGGPGAGDGQFTKPRAVAADGRGAVYVVDMTGRIQKFTEDGRFILAWRTPSVERGRPTDIECDREGNVIVADTHYQTLRIYAPDGRAIRHWGGEGTGPGQFIYPCGLAVDRAGFIYVSEFGGNDRIHTFTPEGREVAVFGTHGSGPGQFNRPQDLAVAGDGTIYVADACNHRIQILNPDGSFRAAWSGSGDSALRYPYDVAIEAGGTLIVCEFGNNRLQRFTTDGRSLGRWGGPGIEPGRFHAPWDVALGRDGRVFVADAMNHRVQVLKF
jgi:DNA-binding beta-propeller fold protein YncE